MIVGIDSSNNKSLVCVVFGSNENIHNTYISLCNLFKKYDWEPPLHWKKLSSKIKKSLASPTADILNKSELKIWIFRTVKPMGEKTKEYYLRRVPNKIAYSLELLVASSAGVLQIQADKDFEITKTRGTRDFLKYLVRQLACRIYGSYIPILESSGSVSADVKIKDLTLKIIATDVLSENSKAVQIADIILGIYKVNKKNLRFREIAV